MLQNKNNKFCMVLIFLMIVFFLDTAIIRFSQGLLYSHLFLFSICISYEGKQVLKRYF